MIEFSFGMDTNTLVTEKIIEYFAWPFAFVLICLAALIILRNPLSNLIGRIRNISRNGIDITTPQSPQVKEGRMSAAEELMRAFDSVVLLEQEKNIKEDIEKRGLVQDEEIKKVLIRVLAANQIELLCEKTYRMIYGSQIKILQHLNYKGVLGDTLENIKKFYDYAVTAYPHHYQGDTFDRYIKFLADSFLIQIEGENVKITPFGIEFLGYLVKGGLLTEKLL
ncbi:MAG TPA: hypothetical protein ACFYD2_10280 [Candidatus Avalokitesvara rifleensis]|uniref:hypothetical protein n=1 Tax=Candidatus Avalokitesvara rifleensis TaxID=3367620 RepID=UPI002713EFAB|nr:hypothetical protein [Candidatus Brocadiales bacterium]